MPFGIAQNEIGAAVLGWFALVTFVCGLVVAVWLIVEFAKRIPGGVEGRPGGPDRYPDRREA